MSEMEQYQQQRHLVLDCYVAAIRNAAHYAIELDDSITKPHREYLTGLAEEVSAGDPGILEDSRATLRGLFRDYRDKAARYLNQVREELAGTAHALQEIVNTLAQSDGSQDGKLRSALANLQTIAQSPEGAPVRQAIAAATQTIQQSVEEIRRQHQVTVSQFLVEIQVLHKRIDTLESAAALDEVTKLFTRREIEARIRSGAAGKCLLLIRVAGFRLAELNFDRSVAEELAGAFTRRLRNCVPDQTAIGRWGVEEFVAIVPLARAEAVALGSHLAEHLSGSYACLRSGKTVRPSLELRVGVVDIAGETIDRVLERVRDVLGG
jgi:GGDEF domain-containing protein